MSTQIFAALKSAPAITCCAVSTLTSFLTRWLAVTSISKPAPGSYACTTGVRIEFDLIPVNLLQFPLTVHIPVCENQPGRFLSYFPFSTMFKLHVLHLVKRKGDPVLAA